MCGGGGDRGPRKPVSCSVLPHKVSMSGGSKHTCGVKSPGATEGSAAGWGISKADWHISLHLSLVLFSFLHGKRLCGGGRTVSRAPLLCTWSLHSSVRHICQVGKTSSGPIAVHPKQPRASAYGSHSLT